MPARQQHGFDYQEHIIKQFSLRPSGIYTGKNDAYSLERDGKELPVQIKSIKKGASIDLGDYKRNKNKDREFAIFVGFWEHIKSNIVEEHLLIPPIAWWHGLFVMEEMYDASIFSFLSEISNSPLDDAKWVAGRKFYTYKWKEYWAVVRESFENKWKESYTERLVLPRFKRDHKTQKRIQCAIPNKIFYKHFLRWE